MPTSDDRVGPGRPPKHSQFRKGQSGNPNGRPKGTLNVATVLGRTLRERVVINENGRRRTITKLEAAVTQIVNKAATGDMQAFKILSALVDSAEQRLGEPAPKPNQEPNDVDKRVIENLLKRFAHANPTEVTNNG